MSRTSSSFDEVADAVASSGNQWRAIRSLPPNSSPTIEFVVSHSVACCIYLPEVGNRTTFTTRYIANPVLEEPLENGG